MAHDALDTVRGGADWARGVAGPEGREACRDDRGAVGCGEWYTWGAARRSWQGSGRRALGVQRSGAPEVHGCVALGSGPGTSSGRHVTGEALIGEGRHGGGTYRERRRGWHRLLAADSIELAATLADLLTRRLHPEQLCYIRLGGLCTRVAQNARGVVKGVVKGVTRASFGRRAPSTPQLKRASTRRREEEVFRGVHMIQQVAAVHLGWGQAPSLDTKTRYESSIWVLLERHGEY